MYLQPHQFLVYLLEAMGGPLDVELWLGWQSWNTIIIIITHPNESYCKTNGSEDCMEMHFSTVIVCVTFYNTLYLPG